MARVATRGYVGCRLVSIRQATPAATGSGNRTPSNSFSVQALKKVRFTIRKKPLHASTNNGRKLQRRAISLAKTVLIVISDTATP
ncbi:hypothetical protein [Methylobacterium komagatae]|uniref:hypothetical protein n=1 Tax=Methylobacterium komagatae TaxID=374425 RepID=UPI00366A9C6C